jgi:hypothetical protein
MNLSRRLALLLLISASIIGCGRNNAKHFEESLLHSIKANEISVALPELQDSAPKEVKEKEKLMLQRIEQSLRAAEKVSTDFLRTLHPGLPVYYKDHLMKGQRLYMEGIKGNDPAKQFQGNALVME